MTRLKFIACLLVSLATLWWAFSGVNFSELGDALSRLSSRWALVLAAIYLSSFLLRAWRWRLTLAPVALVPAGASFSSIVLGYAANNILPGRLGEIVRAVALSAQTSVSTSTAIASVFVERVFDATILLLFLGLSLSQLPSASSQDHTLTALAAAALAACGTGFAGLAVARIAPERALQWFARFVSWTPGALHAKLMSVATDSVRAVSFIEFSTTFAATAALGIAIWATEAAVFWLAAYSMGLSSSLWLALFALAVVNFGILVPAAPGYVGVFQAAGVYAYGRWGIGEPEALACIILIHAVQYLPITFTGAILLPASGLSLASLCGPADHAKVETPANAAPPGFEAIR
ncbi:MAG: lysylphosphatidylglycerol synthase transmembrane domain-containing protein [Planctomycetota bacterium]